MNQAAEFSAVDASSGLVAPVDQAHRQSVLDFIRGIAIFGILIVNIQSYGNVLASYFNPTINGDFSGLNSLTWFFTHTIVEQKFYTIFSMLFGAGIVLMAEKAIEKGRSPASLHYRRSFLLLAFGLLHGFFIWYGDILTTYAIFALFVFFAWKARPRNLMITGLILSSLVSLMMFMAAGNMPEDQVLEMQNNFVPGAELIQREVNAYLGSWSESQAMRTSQMQTMLSYIVFAGIRIAGCMLLGMAFYKMGILNGKKSTAFYRNMTLICLLPGLPFIYYGAELMSASGFKDAVQVQMVYGQINFLTSIIVAFGYIALFNWIYKSLSFSGLKKRIEAVGQMAFTNYISHSIICTTLFYGFGFGLFNHLERYELLLVAFGIILLQILWSKWWLTHFHFGPLEWLWRSLTYFKAQPFKIK